MGSLPILGHYMTAYEPHLIHIITSTIFCFPMFRKLGLQILSMSKLKGKFSNENGAHANKESSEDREIWKSLDQLP